MSHKQIYKFNRFYFCGIRGQILGFQHILQLGKAALYLKKCYKNESYSRCPILNTFNIKRSE